MSTRKTTLIYSLLIAVASLAVGMVIASRLDLTPSSSAQTVAAPPMNSAPITGAIDAQTFRNIAKAKSPMVVNIRTEMTRRGRISSDFFGGGGARRPVPAVLRRTERPDAGHDRRSGQEPGAGPQSPRGRRQRAPPAPASSSARTASS